MKTFLRLQCAKDVGPISARSLIERFGTIEAVFEASTSALEQVEGIGRARAAGIRAARSDDAPDREMDRAAECGVRIICLEDAEYPRLLKHIPDAPLCLYVKGASIGADGPTMAIVGSRRSSRYGLEQAERFGGSLAHAGFTVVSGMARGADGAAHRGALNAGGRTVAVLGCGLAHVYPPEHKGLAEAIVQQGALVSALPMDTPPDASHFPPRNRIIVGMSLGVLVIEAGKQSGALISARLATEYDREVFALPGMITNPYAHGTNALIRESSAKLITSLDDILDDFGDLGRLMKADGNGTIDDSDSAARVPPLSDLERSVFETIGADETPLEHIATQSGVSPAAVASTLTKLQLKGVIVQRPGNMFVRRA
ncbi:MAG: DNA-protecting protein DprA [Phycisphaerales bacterium]|nr:DNA-protecting protein DprA [Phycisphaerales bacterium]